ncbi:Thermostable beta-glucosidase B [Synechococcus sp. CBW1107]|nr:Thermostable beta-glucosidase B [Synechococcus sp. CBW1107]
MAAIALRDTPHRHPWPAGVLPRLGLKGLWFVDGPRGVVLHGGATTFPVAMARGASWDPALEQQIGEAIGREARSFGANWVAAVCVNLLRFPGWGRAQETYGEDPVHVGAMGAAITRGLQRHCVACVKHLALNSIDSSRFVVNVQINHRALHELYLPQFKACVDAGAGSVMSAYNRVNGEWCGQHRELLNQILKGRWGFEGLVVSDFIFGIRDGVKALQAGQDLEMPFRMVWEGCLEQALADGRVAPQRLNDAVRRQLQLQLTMPPGDVPSTVRNSPAHRRLARQAATESIVLLRNQAEELPWRELRSLAVIGPLAQTANLGDHGSSDTRPRPGQVITPLEGLRRAAPDLRLLSNNSDNPTSAAATAAQCDAALVVAGLDWRLEGEHIHPGDIAPILALVPPPQWLVKLLGRKRLQPWWPAVGRAMAWITSHASPPPGGNFASGDRTDLHLPSDQIALIEAVAAANPHTVVALMGGGAILTQPWDQHVAGLLLLWYPGQEGGHALADVLLGHVSPSGHLPFAIPADPAHLPSLEPRALEVPYDLWHGYRRLQRDQHSAAYPFGFGLSYCRFAWSELSLKQSQSAVQVALKLHNQGTMRAAAVVQVYLEAPGLQLERPPRTLVAFQRLELERGERRRLELEIPLRRLAVFDPAQDGWVLESGMHRLVVAEHSEHTALAGELRFEGGWLEA